MLLYFAGTMIMYEPAEECIIDFWKEGILKKLPVSSSNPVFIKAASQLRDSCTDNSSSTMAMSEDYKRLFSNQLLPIAPLYESFYRKGNLIRENYTQEVTEFYNSYGWKSKIRVEKKDDHLGVELLFLTILVEKYLSFDDEACRREITGEIRRFIELHLLSWIRDWDKEVQNNSRTISYKGISSLILACVEDIHSIMGKQVNVTAEEGFFRN